VVFVLREAFEFDFGEIAEVLGISDEACRQRYSRARRHLRDEPVTVPSPAVHRALLERLMAAVSAQRVDEVVELLTDDALLVSDGGGVVSAAIRPVEGRDRIARVLVHLAAKAQAEAPLTLRWANVNGSCGVLLLREGAIHSAITVEASSGAVRRIYVIRNPNKLAGVVLPQGPC
jgi:RNA polymerase sigma-70 factor (ECF subfamily)